MPHTAAEITRDQLVVYARDAGYGVSFHQLTRWHKRGLLPRPHRRALGRGRGTESRYPAAAKAQLLELLRLRDHGTTGLDRLAWGLWWSGFPVTRGARAFLEDELDRVERALREGWGRFQDENPDNPIDRASDVRGAYHLGQIRRRVGRARFPTVVRMMMEVALGWFKAESWDPEDKAIVAKAFTAGRAKAPDPSGTVELMEMISADFNAAAICRIIHEASDTSLERARDELQAIFRGLVPHRPLAMEPAEERVWLLIIWFVVCKMFPRTRSIVDEVLMRLAWADIHPALPIRMSAVRTGLLDVQRAYDSELHPEKNGAESTPG